MAKVTRIEKNFAQRLSETFQGIGKAAESFVDLDIKLQNAKAQQQFAENQKIRLEQEQARVKQQQEMVAQSAIGSIFTDLLAADNPRVAIFNKQSEYEKLAPIAGSDVPYEQFSKIAEITNEDIKGAARELRSVKGKLFGSTGRTITQTQLDALVTRAGSAAEKILAIPELSAQQRALFKEEFKRVNAMAATIQGQVDKAQQPAKAQRGNQDRQTALNNIKTMEFVLAEVANQPELLKAIIAGPGAFVGKGLSYLPQPIREKFPDVKNAVDLQQRLTSGINQVTLDVINAVQDRISDFDFKKTAQDIVGTIFNQPDLIQQRFSMLKRLLEQSGTMSEDELRKQATNIFQGEFLVTGQKPAAEKEVSTKKTVDMLLNMGARKE